jgi:hypothetical protein
LRGIQRLIDFKTASGFKNVILLFACSLSLSGCGDKFASPPVVSIQSASPTGSDAVVAGDRVAFVVEVRATGLPQTAEVGLVIQSAIRESVASADMVSVTNGKTVKLTVIALIPKTTSIHLFTPLYVAGQTESVALDSRVYKVAGFRGN